MRRWTAPRDGAVDIAGHLWHDQPAGDGVEARVLVGSGGGPPGTAPAARELGRRTACRDEHLTAFPAVAVRAGDTIDFVVGGRAGNEADAFHWTLTLRYTDAAAAGVGAAAVEHWGSRTDFADPARTPPHLTAWEELAQLLLLSNEFTFVD